MMDAVRVRARPFEQGEVALVRAALARPGWLDPPAEAALRHALNLARVGRVRAPGGEELDLWELLAPFRSRVASSLVHALRRDDEASRGEVARLAGPLGEEAWTWR